MKLIFAGTPDFAARHLAVIANTGYDIVAVITQPDKPGKRGKTPVASPVKQLAEGLGLHLLQPPRLKAGDIAVFNADLMLVVAYGQILKADLLQLPRYGCINVHASLLPRWRGAAPIQRAVLAGDSQTGICIMQMDPGLDTGDILLQKTVSIDMTDTSLSLIERLSDVGPKALLEVIRQIESGTVVSTPQRDDGMTYASKITKDEARISWRASNLEISRQIKAFNPDPVAFTQLGDLRVKIWQASIGTSIQQGKPGEIVGLSEEGIEVTCGHGSLLISAIQLPLGKGAILNGRDILNARRDLLSPGNSFA